MIFRVRVFLGCFLSLGFMFLGLGFVSNVSKFRVFVFRARVFLECFLGLGFLFLGFLSLGFWFFRVRVFLGCFLSLGFRVLGLGFASDVS